MSIIFHNKLDMFFFLFIFAQLKISYINNY